MGTGQITVFWVSFTLQPFYTAEASDIIPAANRTLNMNASCSLLFALIIAYCSSKVWNLHTRGAANAHRSYLVHRLYLYLRTSSTKLNHTGNALG